MDIRLYINYLFARTQDIIFFEQFKGFICLLYNESNKFLSIKAKSSLELFLIHHFTLKNIHQELFLSPGNKAMIKI